MINGELIVDNFAGGGGASTGIELATGYSVDIAINHDPEAIKMHKANHPNTKHYCENVWAVDPAKACTGAVCCVFRALTGKLQRRKRVSAYSAGGQGRHEQGVISTYVAVKLKNEKN